MKEMKKQLIDLLNIQAPSGQEQKVVEYVKPILEKMCDKVWLDAYGNLLAEKTVGNGKGATVILSAHMDTVNRLAKGRKVVEENGVFYSTKGILGADDRAGIAIILAVLRNLDKIGFEGTLKVAFSREEEVGCVGSSRMDTNWIAQSDLAIVVDRRGNNDIVVGNFAGAFCSTEVGKFFEHCSELLDMDWQPCEGGVSDACTFSDLGVHSVNLSAGYMNEHTDKEFLVFNDMKKTVNLILQALALVNDFVHTFGEVPQHNEWVKPYYGNYYSAWRDEEEDMIIWEGSERFGTVSAEIVDGHVCISQTYNKTHEQIYITTETFEKIAEAYYRERYGVGTSLEEPTDDEELQALFDKF